MSIWNADLTTRMGAESAADNGGLACFFFAGFSVLGLALSGVIASYDTPEGIAVLVITGTLVLISIVAGLRLKAGKGAFLGVAATVLMILELAGRLINGDIGFGIIFQVILLIVLIQGVRGAWALRNEAGFDEDDMETFE